LGYNYSVPLDKWNISDLACDYIYTGKNKIDFGIPGTLGLICDADTWQGISDQPRTYPLFNAAAFKVAQQKSSGINFITLSINDVFDRQLIEIIRKDKTAIPVLTTTNDHGMAEQRRMFIELIGNNISNPVIIKRTYTGTSSNEFQLHAATDCGGLLIDGFGDGVWLQANSSISPQLVNNTAFGLLQATRTRISKTEYISCPSCGRTLFDLQETTAKIRSRTDHLKGVKIGIMGCIVNGPGEMADADYGYVGVGVGKITLYKGKEVVQRSIDADKAVDALIELIKQHGDWVEKQV
jgi:(E)-4-hydroxy-3-methylbut-2-enyl-diphosphate synthase